VTTTKLKAREGMEHIMLVKEEKTIPLREEISSADPIGTSTTILKQQHFVLVHGISGGSWCWYKIKSLMENSGYKVSCIDLKSAGIDQSDADSVLSFDDYNQPLLDFMSSLPDNQKVVLYYVSVYLYLVFKRTI
jgi:hypothetical protein